MNIKFTKMHGTGNDYIYVNCLDGELEAPGKISEAMSQRHFSVGADGLVMICCSDVADAKMRMFNADGSEGRMCGNAIRCVGKYLYDNKIVDKTEMTIETLSGIKTLKIEVSDGCAVGAEVDMGVAVLTPSDIPVVYEGERMISAPVEVDGVEYELTAVSMGNPHAVCFVPEVDSLELEKLGPSFENHKLFPERVNTEFVRVIDENTLRMRVWERGSGETYACGTGACATVVAAVLCGYCRRDEEVTVQLRGGELKIVYKEDGHVFMSGPAKKVYEGVYTYDEDSCK